jgi:pimeloyl-ACP methyl ester carboxylesterase
LAVVALCMSGCATTDLATADRMAHGLVVVLPGIEGRGPLNIDVARGLDEGGVNYGIEIFDWGTGSAAGLLIHLTDLQRNMAQARRLAQRIEQYQRAYPGRPVHVLGHSGGAGLALLALEALPPYSRITGAILLAAAVSPQYDLRPALQRIQYAVYSFYCLQDFAFLGVGTGIFGTIDRAHGPSAGAVGFRLPDGLDEAGRRLYELRLRQIPWSSQMWRDGHHGGHLGWANRRFVRTWLAPLIIEEDQAAAASLSPSMLAGAVPANQPSTAQDGGEK